MQTWKRSASTLAAAAILAGCGGRSEPAAQAAQRTEPQRVVRVGEPCVQGEPPRLVKDDFAPIDMNDDASIMKAAGQIVMVCAPVRSARSGRVVDDATSAPVANAVLTVESWETPAPIGGALEQWRTLRRTVEIRSDPHGRFDVPAQFDWQIGILAADGLPFFIDSWCVRAPGYEALLHDPWTATTERSLSEVRLRPGTERQQLPADSPLSPCGLEPRQQPVP